MNNIDKSNPNVNWIDIVVIANIYT